LLTSPTLFVNKCASGLKRITLPARVIAERKLSRVTVAVTTRLVHLRTAAKSPLPARTGPTTVTGAVTVRRRRPRKFLEIQPLFAWHPACLSNAAHGWALDLTAKYVNYFEVGVNDVEVFLQLGQRSPVEGDPPMIHTSLVLAPSVALEVSRVLAASLARYPQESGPRAANLREG
jgi:hypothetical protein